MIRRIAVVPHPPLLVPELVPGTERDTVEVREAVLAAVHWLREGSQDWLAVGAHSGADRVFTPGAQGSFAGFGVRVPVSLAQDGGVYAGVHGSGGRAELPLPALIAGWLRDRAGAQTVHLEVLDECTPAEECIALGKRLAAQADHGALLVLGDGSHRHGALAPGGPDERAPAFDAAVAAALAAVDVGALGALDVDLAAELGAVGRAPWQVAAGVADGSEWQGRLLYSGAPFGVAYHVATWERV